MNLGNQYETTEQFMKMMSLAARTLESGSAEVSIHFCGQKQPSPAPPSGSLSLYT
jgi:hypothetical protein